MIIVRSIKALDRLLAVYRRRNETIGFVPTMGYFHEGHLSLMRKAKQQCDRVVVSLYVNPTQFGKNEDLSRYPRNLKRDADMTRKESVDILFVPSDNEMYSKSYLTYIDVAEVSEGLCGQFRPGHFRGVATIVNQLLNIVRPTVMYLGAKDAQQVVVIKTMVRDLHLPVSIKVEPTVREKDGLAMSSRNMYLSPKDRLQAANIFVALKAARVKIQKGERKAQSIIDDIKNHLKTCSGIRIQYVACVNAENLKPLVRLEGKVLIALAVYIGQTRLIDNMTVRL